MSEWSGVSVAGLAACALLAACASKDNSAVHILDGKDAASQVQPIRVLKAEEIKSTLGGRTWQYTRGDGTGLITFNSDGTSAYQDDTKGTGTGAWSVRDGELCESFDRAPALQCGEFKSTGDAYFSGKSRFVEMKL